MGDHEKTEQFDAMLLHMASQHEGGVHQVIIAYLLFHSDCRVTSSISPQLPKFGLG